MLDTGAGMTVLSSELTEHLAISRQGLCDGAGGMFSAYAVHVRFSLLDKQIREAVKAPPGDLERFSRRAGFKVSGIIGQDLLRQFSSYTIDNKNQKFIFEL